MPLNKLSASPKNKVSDTLRIYTDHSCLLTYITKKTMDYIIVLVEISLSSNYEECLTLDQICGYFLYSLNYFPIKILNSEENSS